VIYLIVGEIPVFVQNLWLHHIVLVVSVDQISFGAADIATVQHLLASDLLARFISRLRPLAMNLAVILALSARVLY
jgi:hypothetical protein